MCLATAALVAGIAGAGVSAVGTVEQGQATANAANYRSQVARNNETIAKQNADYAQKAGAAQALTQGLKGAAAGGKLKATQAASGVDVNSGSNVDVRSGQRAAAQLDTENVLSNALLESYGYRAQATNFEAQSGLETMTAEQAPIGADIAAGGGLLSNASGLAFKWKQAG